MDQEAPADYTPSISISFNLADFFYISCKYKQSEMYFYTVYLLGPDPTFSATPVTPSIGSVFPGTFLPKLKQGRISTYRKLQVFCKDEQVRGGTMIRPWRPLFNAGINSCSRTSPQGICAADKLLHLHKQILRTKIEIYVHCSEFRLLSSNKDELFSTNKHELSFNKDELFPPCKDELLPITKDELLSNGKDEL